jgi:hypothetical protein
VELYRRLAEVVAPIDRELYVSFLDDGISDGRAELQWLYVDLGGHVARFELRRHCGTAAIPQIRFQVGTEAKIHCQQ